MSIFKKKKYLDMRCSRCGGRVYKKDFSYYCENCGQYPIGSEAYEEAACIDLGSGYRAKYERKKRLQEEASALGDTRKVIGETYIEYLQDYMDDLYGKRYFECFDKHSPFYYGFYKQAHALTLEKQCYEMRKIFVFNRSHEVRPSYDGIYQKVIVDSSRTNDREITIVFEDFHIAVSCVNEADMRLIADNGYRVDYLVKKYRDEYFEELKKDIKNKIIDCVKFLKLTTYGFDDKYADHIFLEFR